MNIMVCNFGDLGSISGSGFSSTGSRANIAECGWGCSRPGLSPTGPQQGCARLMSRVAADSNYSRPTR